MKLKPIERQVVVVMGAASGIGRAAALTFAARGARVVAAARRESALDSLAAEIREEGGTAHVVRADVTDPEQVRAATRRAVEEFGGLDTWVQVAGVGLWSALEETEPEEWARVIDVNLNGQAYGAMAALPHLKRAGGALIHVSSVESRMAVPWQSAYGASKHALHAMIRALRLELTREGAPVSVTEIMPAGTNTPIFDQARTRIGVRPQPFPPFYTAEVTVRAILHAAEHPVEEMVLGGVSKAGMVVQSLAPGLLDALLLCGGFEMQRRPLPKGEADGDNLFSALPCEQVEGTLEGWTRSWSSFAWLERHPAVRRSLAAGLGVTALLAARALVRRNAGSG
jgi:NAD(P)-dependent dehydrogenase (short-subunit alcohol dehydrogenase family)